METHQAREHLEMVDRILANANAKEKTVRVIPGMLIAWGLACTAIDAGQQMYFSHVAGKIGDWVADAALLLGFLYTIALSIKVSRVWGSSDRVSVVEIRMGKMMGAVWFTVLVAAFAQPHVFAGWGGAAIWSMGAAIMMLSVGFNGDKRATVGGLVLLASVLAGNYLLPQTPGYALAAGFLLGYALPGVLYLFDGPREA